MTLIILFINLSDWNFPELIINLTYFLMKFKISMDGKNTYAELQI